MHRDYVEIVRKISLFDGLTRAQLTEVIGSFALQHLTEGEVLFQQGQQADFLYVVIEGQLIATLEYPNGNIEVMGNIRVGDFVGETGLFSQQPRSLTVTAVIDTLLIRLAREDLVKFIGMVPSAVGQILANTAFRTQTALKFAENQLKRVDYELIFLIAEPGLAGELSCLQAAAKNFNKCFIINAKELHALEEKQACIVILDQLEQLDRNYTGVLYVATTPLGRADQMVLQRADRLVVCAQATAGLALAPDIGALMAEPSLINIKNQRINKELVLIWPLGVKISQTRLWLQSSMYHGHYHVRAGQADSYARLLRRFTKQAVGLVLGGGGSRGWVHVGVFKALEEKNIPIDAIGGTSCGAGLAALRIMHKTIAEIIASAQQINRAVQKSSSWRALTFPLASIFNALSVTKQIQELYGELAIEDLEIPYFAVVSNINAHTEVVKTSGPLWLAVRASASIPGLFPPVVENGELLVDGGLINNLPVDHMHRWLGTGSSIIASDLGMVYFDKTAYYFPPYLTIKELILAKLGLSDQTYVFPSFTAMVLDAMLIGALPKYKRNRQLATYCISPDLQKYKVLDFKQSSASEMIEIGYRATLAALGDWKEGLD